MSNKNNVSPKRKKQKFRMLFLGLGSMIIIVSISVTIGRYWVQIYDKYQEKDRLDEELTALQDKQKELELDAKKLQDPEYIARYAREKYSYSKEGEFIIKIPEDDK